MPEAIVSRPRKASSARRSLAAPAPARVRWDRVARMAMGFVLIALLYLYLSAGLHMLSTWQQARHDSSAVSALAREHSRLAREREALVRQGAVEAQARRLGMVKPGEQPYVVGGLPSN